MADDVYRFTCPDGDFAWHGSVADLRKAHPNARITGRMVTNELGEGSWEPANDRQAMAAERKANDAKAESETERKASGAKAQPAEKNAAPAVEELFGVGLEPGESIEVPIGDVVEQPVPAKKATK
jgi:hypothetical protein